MKTNFNDHKEPESRNILGKKNRRGRPDGQKLTATIRLGLTEAEMDKIIKLAEKLGATYSHTVRSLLKEGGHI